MSNSKITFTEGRVLSNQLQNKIGNMGETVFNLGQKTMSTGDKLSNVMQNTSSIADWSSLPVEQGFGTDGLLDSYLDQSHMSSYFQDNPWPVLKFPKNYGVEHSLGGTVRGWLPPGSFPGNVISKNPNGGKISYNASNVTTPLKPLSKNERSKLQFTPLGPPPSI